MKLIQSTFAVTESTFGGSTSPSQSHAGGAAGAGLFRIDRIVVTGVSSVAANTSGGVELHYNRMSGTGSSAGAASSMVILPSPTSVGLTVELENLDLDVSWFDFESNEAGQYAVWVWGK